MKKLGGLLFALALVLSGIYAYHHVASDRQENQRLDAVLKASLPDLDGKMQALSQWRGKVIVVNFWASWCPPCRREMPGFVDLQEKYRKQGLVFVGIALDSPEHAGEFARRIGVNYPVLADPNSSVLEVSGLPYTLVFDRKGDLVDTHTGALPEDELDSIVSKLL